MSDKDEVLKNDKTTSDEATQENATTEAGTTEVDTTEVDTTDEISTPEVEHSATVESEQIIDTNTDDIVTTESNLVAQDNEQTEGSSNGGIMKFLPWVIAIVAVVALVIVLFMDPTGSKEEVASVNGEKITRHELNEYMSSRIGKQVLTNMINDKLIEQEATKAGVKVVEADVDAELAKLIKTYPSEEQFNMILAQSGMSVSDLKDQLRTELKIRKILEPTITIKDEDIQKTYNENKESFAIPEQVQASHILVDTKEEAEAVLKDLKNGADFAAIAKEKNKDATKDKGGDLGYFGRADMVAEFSDAAFKLNVGEISGVVQTQFGFHIIKVTDKKAAVTPTFEEKKEEIRKNLVDAELSKKVPAWMQEIQSKATIVNKLDKPAVPEATPAATPAATEAPKK